MTLNHLVGVRISEILLITSYLRIMSKSKENKTNELGMNPSTANGRLRKIIIFEFAKQLGKDVCHQCGKKIDTIDEFSIEHKEPWMYTSDPKKLFFDIDNIAFSHLFCNFSVRRAKYAVDSVTGYRGVVLRTDLTGKKYQARFWHGNKNHHLGFF